MHAYRFCRLYALMMHEMSVRNAVHAAVGAQSNVGECFWACRILASDTL